MVPKFTNFQTVKNPFKIAIFLVPPKSANFWVSLQPEKLYI